MPPTGDCQNCEERAMNAATLPSLQRLEGHMLELVKSSATHGEALRGISHRLDVLNGKVAQHERDGVEIRKEVVEIRAAHETKIAEIQREIAVAKAANQAKQQVHKHWLNALKPVASSALHGIAWAVGAVLIWLIFGKEHVLGLLK